MMTRLLYQKGGPSRHSVCTEVREEGGAPDVGGLSSLCFISKVTMRNVITSNTSRGGRSEI